jgi:transcriptional regulator with XRE-family HTH domain
MSTTATAPGVGPLLRDWRQRRRLSQLELALDAGISARHLSFVETGRSLPSADMVLHLAEQLEVPYRERNRMMLAAGYAPVYRERGLDDPEMEPIREALERVLKGHEPYPAVVVDRRWNMVAGNSAVGMLTAGVAKELLAPPVNVLRVSLHPDGMAPHILNLGEWRHHLLERLDRQVALTGDEAVAELLEELRNYPGPEAPKRARRGPADEIVASLRLAGPNGELSFFSTVATFGTAVDITVAELSIESFYPADSHTAEVVRSLPAG